MIPIGCSVLRRESGGGPKGVGSLELGLGVSSPPPLHLILPPSSSSKPAPLNPEPPQSQWHEAWINCSCFKDLQRQKYISYTAEKGQRGGNWPSPSTHIPQHPLTTHLRSLFCTIFKSSPFCMEPVCCLSLIQMFILSSTDVTNRGDETSNTVMKEFFSWHSTLKPEDAFPARTRNDNARQDILDADLATVYFPPKDVNIYVHIQ